MSVTPNATSTTSGLLYTGSDWNFDLLAKVHDAVEEIAVGEMGLNVYPNQIEVITSEQMLDAYASIGMPIMYPHWSYGKHYAREELLYRKGARALAYELVINSNPCVSYVMEENTMTMQTLVIAHAAFGHNHFFKNNHLFRQWTRADRVLDDLSYAKHFIASCEEKHGVMAVESLLDSAHALMNCGISKYAAPTKTNKQRELKAKERHEYEEANFSDLWRTLPQRTNNKFAPSRSTHPSSTGEGSLPACDLPEENVLRFLANHAPKLKDWQREILVIVSKNAQYFYPQRQTKLMNEGCATYVHYQIMNRLHDHGKIDDGAMLEFLHSHSSVVAQPDFDDRRFGGINPYALGFAMMRDIERICVDPDNEDRHWFPDIAGCGRPMDVLKELWAEYRDESFVLQFLSPRLIREMHLFSVSDDSRIPYLSVEAIHDESGYRQIRRSLASQYDLSRQEPEIEIVEADLSGNRRLSLVHRVRKNRLLAKEDCNRVLCHLANLWGYGVRLSEVNEEGETLERHEVVSMSMGYR
ncbi:SpoVR family protein [Rubripirellula amarantea]|uniref:SpoVR family protein n=1 Tax=Rubripirellula amarantea TaxID=2527999 RepID=A0A5C5WSE1_9BACT|nr:SpoVR family protein [Rubripirellula amarantea]TWT53410.1 SpoVR family protein [Rubripirellula amarantea]